MVWLLLFPSILYALGWLWVFWQLNSIHDIGENKIQNASIIIPFRNEAKHIIFLLDDLNNQTLKPDEVILVDDHSTDQGKKLVMDWLIAQQQNQKYLKWKCIVNAGEGKKMAIATGVREAKADWIITTDADCRMNSQWFVTIIKSFHHETSASAAWVSLTGENIWQRCQKIEFKMLLASGFSNLVNQKPGMVSGANFAFRRDVFNRVGGYNDNVQIASGDDEFLLRKILKNKFKVHAQIEKNASVSTEATINYKDFLMQRTRWASKWKYHQDWQTKSLAIIMAFIQLYWIVSILAIIVNSKLALLPVSIAWIIKMIGEYVVLTFIKNKTSEPFDWPAFFFMQVFYPFFVWHVIFQTFKKKMVWKDRQIKI